MRHYGMLEGKKKKKKESIVGADPVGDEDSSASLPVPPSTSSLWAGSPVGGASGEPPFYARPIFWIALGAGFVTAWVLKRP